MSNRIAVHLADQEGGLHIDTLTGQVVTPIGERPEWANGYATALLGSRTGWYEQRLGTQLPDAIRSPELLDARDLDWVGIDNEGDEVNIEADGDYRMEKLAEIMGIDREDFDGQKNFKNALASAEVAHTYATQPTSEATLEEVEGKTFSEVEKQAATG